MSGGLEGERERLLDGSGPGGGCRMGVEVVGAVTGLRS